MPARAALLTRLNIVIHGEHRLPSSSPGLVRFLAYLWWKRRQQTRSNSGWVGLEELARVMDRPNPKKMQRYMNTLESARIPLVEYHKKTAGPWRLRLPHQQVSIDREDAELLIWLGFSPADEQPPILSPEMGSLADHLRQALMADALFAEQGLSEQEANDAITAYQGLLAAPSATAAMKAALIQRLCWLHRRRNDFSAWGRELAELEKLLSSGELAGADFAARLHLLRMFLRFDEGRRDEAYHILERIDPDKIQDAFTLGRYWNAMGLAALYRHKLSCQPVAGCMSGPACVLQTALGHFSRALGYTLAVNDYDGLEGVCYNIGNALYRCVRLADQENDEMRTREAAQWIGLCEITCHRFGVGGASHWSRLMLTDMALRHGWSFVTLNLWVNGAYASYTDLEALLQHTLAITARQGNRLEQAECYRLLTVLYGQRNQRLNAASYREKAIAIYRDLGRQDKVDALLLPPPPQ